MIYAGEALRLWQGDSLPAGRTGCLAARRWTEANALSREPIMRIITAVRGLAQVLLTALGRAEGFAWCPEGKDSLQE